MVRGVSNKLDQHGVDDEVSNSDISSNDNAAKLILDCIADITSQATLDLNI